MYPRKKKRLLKIINPINPKVIKHKFHIKINRNKQYESLLTYLLVEFSPNQNLLKIQFIHNFLLNKTLSIFISRSYFWIELFLSFKTRIWGEIIFEVIKHFFCWKILYMLFSLSSWYWCWRRLNKELSAQFLLLVNIISYYNNWKSLYYNTLFNVSLWILQIKRVTVCGAPP